MIRVLMFDLGETLLKDEQHLFPHVKEALTAISALKAADGKPLQTCLVSDFKMPVAPVTPEKVTALFNEYLGILAPLGLRPFFEPVDKRITLSTHAGVPKPDRKIFELAVKRLGLSAQLEECLLITEEPSHIKHAREKLHMKALQFRSSKSTLFDFKDWQEAPALISQLLSAHHIVNEESAAKTNLASAKDFDLVYETISVPGIKELQKVKMAVPVKGKGAGGKGQAGSPSIQKPSKKNVSEVAAFAKSLAMSGQIEGVGKKKKVSAPTHQIETDEKGAKTLVRKRFSAY